MHGATPRRLRGVRPGPFDRLQTEIDPVIEVAALLPDGLGQMEHPSPREFPGQVLDGRDRVGVRPGSVDQILERVRAYKLSAGAESRQVVMAAAMVVS